MIAVNGASKQSSAPPRRGAAPARAGTGPVNGCCGAIGVHYDGCFRAFRNVMIAVNGASKQPSAPPRRGAAPAPCRHRPISGCCGAIGAHYDGCFRAFRNVMIAVNGASKQPSAPPRTRAAPAPCRAPGPSPAVVKRFVRTMMGCFTVFRNVMIAVNGASKQPSARPRPRCRTGPVHGTAPVSGCCEAIRAHYDGCFTVFRNVMIAVNGAGKQPSAPPRTGAAPGPVPAPGPITGCCEAIREHYDGCFTVFRNVIIVCEANRVYSL